MGLNYNIDKESKFFTPSKILGIAMVVIAIFFTPQGKELIFNYSDAGKWSYEKDGIDHVFTGSGFFVNPNKVVVAYSSIRGCAAGVSILTKQGVFDSKIINLDTDNNLAVLATAAERKAYAVISNSFHFEGEKYFIPDFSKTPGEFELKENTTIIDDPSRKNDIIFPQSWMTERNMGAPILNKGGYVVGMITRANGAEDHPIVTGESVARGANLNALVVFLNKNRISYYKPSNNKNNYLASKAYRENLTVGVLCGNHKKAGLFF